MWRYRDYSNAKFGDISAYSTPVNYPTPRLSRGLSVQDVSTLGDHGAARRLARQSSLDQQRDPHRHSHQHRDPHRHSPLPSGHYENAYQDLLKTRKTPVRTGKEEKKRRPISCNKVRRTLLWKTVGKYNRNAKNENILCVPGKVKQRYGFCWTNLCKSEWTIGEPPWKWWVMALLVIT